MIVQIYEIQAPHEAEACIESGVDHIGSVLSSKDEWRQPQLKETIQISRAADVKKEDILHMRKRIMTELKRPASGIDIKLDSGGVEEIEFAVQYLQLRNMDALDVIYQDTVNALKSLFRIGRLTAGDISKLSSSYLLFRTIESYLRLSMKSMIKEGDTVIDYMSEFMGHEETGEFLSVLGESMATVAGTTDKMYK